MELFSHLGHAASWCISWHSCECGRTARFTLLHYRLGRSDSGTLTMDPVQSIRTDCLSSNNKLPFLLTITSLFVERYEIKVDFLNMNERSKYIYTYR